MNWDDLRHFRALAEAGSLSAAARALGVEHATVARRILALEADLGVLLVDRRGRRWTLTAEGARIAAIAERMGAEAHAISRAAEGARSDIAGTVTVSAPHALAAQALTAPLVALRGRHPGLTIRLVGEARAAALDRAEADIALRLHRPEQEDLVITKTGRLDFHLYATPAYLARTPPESWCFIGGEGPLATAPQQLATAAFAQERSFCFHANSLELQQAAARAGAGIAALPDFMAATDPELVPITPGKPLISRDIWLVVHGDIKRAAPVAAVFQCLARVFRPAHPGG